MAVLQFDYLTVFYKFSNALTAKCTYQSTMLLQAAYSPPVYAASLFMKNTPHIRPMY